jgi:hypothetical protein
MIKVVTYIRRRYRFKKYQIELEEKNEKLPEIIKKIDLAGT